MGFSGGGQFTQRFLLLYPERLAAVSIGAPGSVTHIHNDQRWPKGVQDVNEMFGRSVNVDLIKAVNIHMVVGDRDVEAHGGSEFRAWRRSMIRKMESSEVVAHMHDVDDGGHGQGRLGNLQHLHQVWRNAGIESQLDIVKDAGHSADSVRAYVMDFLRSVLN